MIAAEDKLLWVAARQDKLGRAGAASYCLRKNGDSCM